MVALQLTVSWGSAAVWRGSLLLHTTRVLGGYIKNRKLAVVNQGPRKSDDQMSGKRVSGMRHLKTPLVALSGRQSTSTIIVILRD